MGKFPKAELNLKAPKTTCIVFTECKFSMLVAVMKLGKKRDHNFLKCKTQNKFFAIIFALLPTLVLCTEKFCNNF